MEREDSDVSLPELEAVDMATEFEPFPTVTFLPKITEVPIEAEKRPEGISRGASGTLSRASFKPPSRRTQKRNQSNVLQAPGEFSFDDEFTYDSDEDIAPARYSSAAEQHRNMYQTQCRKHGVLVATKVLKQFGKAKFDISGLNLSSRELKPVYIVMIQMDVLDIQNDVDILEIDISGNKLNVKDIHYISEILTVNKSISTLSMRRCGLNGAPIKTLSEFLSSSNTLRKLDIGENNFDDKDAPYVAKIIQDNESISNLILSHNRLGDSGIIIGDALKDNEMISTLDLSWNHIRGHGAVGIAKGIEKNTKLLNLKIAWNGFAFDGCAALGHALLHNSTLATLDLSNNRIHNPAMFELLKGIVHNKALSSLRLAHNPITAPMSSIILERIASAKECGLKELDLEGIVVDKEFDPLLRSLQETRLFLARYDIALPVRKGVVSKIDSKNVFNIDPIRILYFMKEHMRTIDMFLKFDKDNSNSLSREELHRAFQLEGYPISSSAMDTVMNYLDTNRDGDVDFILSKFDVELEKLTDALQESGEFITGERKLKRNLIAEREEELLKQKTGPSMAEKREFSQTYVKPTDVNPNRLRLPQLK